MKLARTLRTAGHDVLYINVGKDDPRYAANGFRSVLILEELLPDGLLGIFQRHSGLRLDWEIRRGLPRLIDALDRELQRLIDEHRPTLAVIDRMLPYAPLFFHRAGVPSALFSTLLPLERDLDHPPLTSGQAPPTTAFERVRIRLHWFLILARQRAATRLIRLHRTYRDLAARCDFPIDDLRGVEAGYQPRVAELITCPACFDLPRPARPQRFYLGPCIDLDRLEPPFDWNRIDPARPLAYCALGSRASAYAGALRFLVRLAEAFTLLPEWQVVIAAGDLHQPLVQRLAGYSPTNVIAMAEAPQLEMLRRARLMVTHGGLGSIKESLYFGVPLAVFPASGDQFGNGARVKHHGLGVVGSLKRSTPVQISRLVRDAGESDAVRARVAAMRRTFVDAERSPRILEATGRIVSAGVPGRGEASAARPAKVGSSWSDDGPQAVPSA